MASECFGIFMIKNGVETFIHNLSSFNIWLRGNIKEFMYASTKELLTRIPLSSEDEKVGRRERIIPILLPDGGICHHEVDIQLDFYRDVSLVGFKKEKDACFIFTKEKHPHNHLILLSKYILANQMFPTIKENFAYIKTEIKCKQAVDEIAQVRNIMIDNVEKILERGEKIEDLVKRSEYLSKSSKDFYRRSKKLNRCCSIV